MSEVCKYNMEFDKELYDTLKRHSEDTHLPISVMIRKFVKLGLIALEPSTTIIIRTEGKQDRELMLL